jgi:hypothetical protein
LSHIEPQETASSPSARRAIAKSSTISGFLSRWHADEAIALIEHKSANAMGAGARTTGRYTSGPKSWRIGWRTGSWHIIDFARSRVPRPLQPGAHTSQPFGPLVLQLSGSVSDNVGAASIDRTAAASGFWTDLVAPSPTITWGLSQLLRYSDPSWADYCRQVVVRPSGTTSEQAELGR